MQIDKMARKRKTRRQNNSNDALLALDLLLSGHDQVIGKDFILQKKGLPLHDDIGNLDPSDLNRFDQSYIDSLVNMESTNTLKIPNNLSNISKNYTEQRLMLSSYLNKTSSWFEKYDITASKELENFDNYQNKVVIRNDAEFNVFLDYIILYRKIKNRRAITHWRLENTDAITSKRGSANLEPFCRHW